MKAISTQLKTTIRIFSIVGATMTFCLSSCERKEKVIDVETPAGSLEVEKNKDTGAVDVEVSEKDQ